MENGKGVAADHRSHGRIGRAGSRKTQRKNRVQCLLLFRIVHGPIHRAVALAPRLDSIPHAELIKSVARRIVDGEVLREALVWAKAMMTRLGLTLNEAKTSLKNARQERFDFLGYSFGPHRYKADGRW